MGWAGEPIAAHDVLPAGGRTYSTDGSSIYYLGKAAQNVMGGAKGGHGGSAPASYSFIVGGYLAYANIEGWSFGHDPKIIVGGSKKPR